MDYSNWWSLILTLLQIISCLNLHITRTLKFFTSAEWRWCHSWSKWDSAYRESCLTYNSCSVNSSYYNYLRETLKSLFSFALMKKLCAGGFWRITVLKPVVYLSAIMTKKPTSPSFITSIIYFQDPNFNNPNYESILGAFPSAVLGIYLKMKEDGINKNTIWGKMWMLVRGHFYCQELPQEQEFLYAKARASPRNSRCHNFWAWKGLGNQLVRTPHFTGQ